LNDLMTIAFLILLGGCIALERKATNEKAPDEARVRLPWDGREKMVFWGLLLLAFVIRIWGFGRIPGGMNQDGAMAAVDARALANYGTDRFGTYMPVHFTAWGYGQMSVLLSYFMVPFIKLFGLNVLSARLPMLLFSMLGLAALYGIGRMLLGPAQAAVFLGFGALNPWHFMQSRWALDCNLFPHVFLLGLFALLMGIRGRKRWIYGSMVFFALCMYAYGIAFYTVPFFLIFMAAYLLVRKILKWSDVLWCVGIYGLISWPICLTMMINAFGWKTMRTFFCTMPYFPYSVRSKDILFFSEEPGKQFLNNLNCLWQIYVTGDYLPWNTIQGFGVITKCFLPFVLLGVYACIRRIREESDQRKKATFVAVLAFFCVGNLSGVITANVNVNRINFLHYSLLILGSLGICFAARWIRKSGYVILAAFLVMSIFFLRAYFTEHAQVLKQYYYHDFLEAVSFAGNGEWNTCQAFVITPDTQYEGAVGVTEILTQFALDVDAEFYQGKKTDENGLTYGEKYRYANALPDEMDPAVPVAYVLKTSRLEEYETGRNAEQYCINVFGDYCVAVPWQNVIR